MNVDSGRRPSWLLNDSRLDALDDIESSLLKFKPNRGTSDEDQDILQVLVELSLGAIATAREKYLSLKEEENKHEAKVHFLDATIKG